MSIFDRIASGISQKALAEGRKRIPGSVQKHLPLARKLLFGGPDALANAGLDLLLERFGVLGGPGSRIPGNSDALLQPLSLTGGITLKEAREIFQECVETEWEKKNLWFITVTNLSGGTPLNINLFATDVSYTAITVAGEPVLVGSGSFDVVTNSERVEVRVTTMDDSYGTVKRWFKERHGRMAFKDGTLGLPVDYLFRVDIMHARVTEALASGDDPYIDSYIVRPGSIDIDLSRRDDNLAELQMSFVEFDTFTALS